MEKLNKCIEDLRVLICPFLKSPTKAKILECTLERLQYLESSYNNLTLKEHSDPDVDANAFDQLNPREVLMDQLPNIISAFNNDDEQDFFQVFNDFGSI